MNITLELWEPSGIEHTVDYATVTERLCMCQLPIFECGVSKVVREPKLIRIYISSTTVWRRRYKPLTKVSPVCVKAILTAERGIKGICLPGFLAFSSLIFLWKSWIVLDTVSTQHTALEESERDITQWRSPNR